jgi:MFS family permease
MTKLLPSVKGLPRAYWLVWAGMLVNKLGTFVVPFLALYLTLQRGFSVERAGLIISLYGLGSLGASACGGLLADRIGRRWTLIAGLGMGAAALGHLAIARDPVHVALATFLLGLFSDVYRPAMSAFVADVVPPEDRARAYGLMYWAINVGFAVSPVLAGLLAGKSFAWLFALDAGTNLVFAAIVLIGVQETRPAEPSEGAERFGLLTPLRDRAFMQFLLLNLALGIVFFQFLSALPLDMRSHGLDAQDYGFLIAINGALITLLQPSASRFLARFRPAHLLALASALVGWGYAATAGARGPWGYAASIAVWTMGEIAMAGLGPAVVAQLSPQNQRGRYQGLFHMSWAAAAFAAPALGTAILGRAGPTALWTGCGVLGSLCALGHLAIGRPRDRALAATPSALAVPTGRTAPQ